ncbi:MAG TPA: hydrogenase 4 subunit F, partial [Steroidobacteraceae bacterium]|nr:hydrogenase 4 subunit F [Steroidobacteraceae bacterium]
MTLLDITLLSPLIGGLLLAIIGHRPIGGWINVVVGAVTFATSLAMALDVFAHGPTLSSGRMFYIDAFNVYLVALTAFVGFTTSIFSRPYMRHEVERGRLTDGRLRLYHSMYQGFQFAMLLALSTNNLGVLWVAMEAATLTTVLLVSLYRTPESIEAAWKYFILCGVGIAQALFGTVLVYFAAEQKLGRGRDDTLLWTVLHDSAASLDPTVLSLAFVFLLVGYGTKVGLVPLHAWLPDAHSEGPTPMSAVLSGLLLNVALYALVRLKMLVDASLQTHLAGYLMMGFGLVSFMVAGLFLHRQHDIKRMYSYSSIEHMGLMTYAFGLGGPLATFGALLHMTVHSLTKSAIFITVGHASQLAGTQRIDKIRGLIRTQPAIGWGLLIGTVAIAGFPPFGVFTSEFLLLTATMKSWPWLAVPL